MSASCAFSLPLCQFIQNTCHHPTSPRLLQEYFLQHQHVDVNAKNDFGESAFAIAAKSHRFAQPLCKILLECGSAVDFTLPPEEFLFATRYDLVLLKQYFQENQHVDLRGSNVLEITAKLEGYKDLWAVLCVHGAAFKFHLPLHEFLTAYNLRPEPLPSYFEHNIGVDVNARNARYKTPLLRAVHSKNVETCEILMAYGAEIRKACFILKSETALEAAIKKGSLEIVKLFVEKGRVSVHGLHRENASESLLHLACRYLRTDVCLFLMNHGCSINELDHATQTFTPLMCALQSSAIPNLQFFKELCTAEHFDPDAYTRVEAGRPLVAENEEDVHRRRSKAIREIENFLTVEFPIITKGHTIAWYVLAEKRAIQKQLPEHNRLMVLHYL